jgi:SRSO17 transposase
MEIIFRGRRPLMQRQFEKHKEKMLAQCEVVPQIFDNMVKRLDHFAKRYVNSFCRQEQRVHAELYLGGLVSDLERKNIESIAYRSGEDRYGLQHFIGSASWEHEPLIETMVGEVAAEIGDPAGVIVFDPSGFPKKGKDSVGVARQWIGRLGKVDNGQVAIYMGYASEKEHALVDTRLYLPKEWTQDKKRRKQCGVPKEIRYQTRHELALEMLQIHGPRLPHAWIAGDDEMGHVTWFREALRNRGEHYLLAVPFNTTIRDLDGEQPSHSHSGAGAQPKRKFESVKHWTEALPKEAWTEITVRDGAKGPLNLKIVKSRVVTKTQWRCVSTEEELLVVTQRQEEDGTWRHDYFLSNAPAETCLQELGRVVKAEHRIEDSLKRAKSEAGLADYEVRSWRGWYHHQVLSLLATWFLIQEALRGRKWTPAITVPQIREGLAAIFRRAQAGGGIEQIRRERMLRLRRNELARFYHWKQFNLLAPLKICL